MGRITRTVRSFADDHPLVRRWVFPVVFMGALLFPLFTVRFTTVEAGRLVAVFLAFSFVAVAFGVALERLIEYAAGEYL